MGPKCLEMVQIRRALAPGVSEYVSYSYNTVLYPWHSYSYIPGDLGRDICGPCEALARPLHGHRYSSRRAFGFFGVFLACFCWVFFQCVF